MRQRRWNWKENIAEGLSRYNDKYKEVVCNWQRILEANHGTSIDYPSPNQVKNAAETYNFPDDLNTLQKILHMQSYNGVDGNHRIQNTSGSGVQRCDGNGTMPDGHMFATCWKFDPTENELEFVPNSKNYISKLNDKYNQSQ